jgi:hypothetical protein
MKVGLASNLAVLSFATIILAGGCSGTPSGSPQIEAPRYQMQVVSSQYAYAYVYRLDTTTGEIETFLLAPSRMMRSGSLKQLHEEMTLEPGPTLPGKRK